MILPVFRFALKVPISKIIISRFGAWKNRFRMIRKPILSVVDLIKLDAAMLLFSVTMWLRKEDYSG